MGEQAVDYRESVDTTTRRPRDLALPAGHTLASYTLSTLLAEDVPENGEMVVMVPFVLLALGRYWQVARARPDRDADEIAFRDPAVLILVASFVVPAVVTQGLEAG